MRESLEMQVRLLVQEDLLEKEMATPSSTLAWRTPWTEDPDGLQSMGLDMTEQIHMLVQPSAPFRPICLSFKEQTAWPG